MLSGWQAPEVLPQSINPSRYQLLGRSALQGMSPVVWRIKGIFPAEGMGAIFGPSGAGKSFLAFDMAAAIASGSTWFGHRSQAAPVIYVALEGESGYKNRITAWEKERLQPLPPSLHLVMQTFKLTEQQDVVDLAAVIPKGSVIFIDTLNRAAPTADENSSKDMGEILEGAKSLQSAISGLVVLIHHTGKDASKGARGHSSFTAALDGAIEVERSINGRAWSVAKAKDGEDGNKKPFKLNTHILGKDGDGDAITSCAVEQDLSAVFKPIEPKGHQQKSALKAIRSALGQSQIKGKAGCGSNTGCISLATAVSAVIAALPTVDKHRRSNRANQLITSLTADCFLMAGLEGDDSWVWAP
jgi:Na+-transporting NADH:ubiquinone oxidoreductase subunit NqrB